jgi:uncharacterized protein
MRAPDDLPRRRPRRRLLRSGRGRIVLVVGLVALFILLTSLRGIAGFYTDYLWFDSLGLWGVRRGILGAQLSLAFIFIAAFFVLAWSNLYVSEMLAPPFRPAGPEDELLERYHDLVAGRMGRVRFGVAAVLALIAGAGASSEWNAWILFTHGGSFGVEDPQFHRDVGFYVFRLPFLSFVVDWLFASLLIVLILTAVAHYLNGGIRVQPGTARNGPGRNGPRVSPQVKAHLSVLLAALALVKMADYWLQRFELTVSHRGVVDGATFTDVNAQLPALNLLTLIALAAGVLFVVNIFRRGWTLPVVAVVLWGFVAIAVGGVYPAFVQQFRVRPNELAKEQSFVERNIEATRAAMGIEDVRTEEFGTPQENPDEVDLAAAAPTVRNIRLWDPSARLGGQTYEQLQRIRDYYRLPDIDVDRYEIDGQMTQVGLSLRSLDQANIPGDSWENEHLGYTHGYGAVVAPSNATVDGEPDFVSRNIPIQTDEGAASVSMEQTGVYFGEDIDGYAIVGTNRQEIDYQPSADETVYSDYDGADGVRVDSWLRRAAFALRFGDVNPLISDYITDDSRVLYIRDVLDRVQTLAPFLHVDGDPYPVLMGDKTVWVVDMFTTTNRYPYAQEANTDDVVAEDSGLRHDFNYVRNSVKAVVDAYDGTVDFYEMPTDDPIIDAYSEAFPDMFSDYDDMPEELKAHLRYPEDLFRVQTSAYGRYHVSDASAFYNEGDLWRVASDPGTAGVEEGPPPTDSSGQPTGEQGESRIAPYYQLLQLPGEEEAEFVMMRPYVPASEEDRSQLLESFMAVRMDPGNYGDLVVYQMPDDDRPDGPQLVMNTIRSYQPIGTLETQLGQRGSEVLYGNLLLLPVQDSLLWVRPFYVQAESSSGQVPQLRYVIAVLGDEVVVEPTLQEALQSLFGQEVETQEHPGEQPPPSEGTPDEGGGEDGGGGGAPTEGTVEEQAGALIQNALDLYEEADTALAEGDLGTYQDRVNEAQDLIAQAADLLGGGSGDSGGGGGGGESTTTTAEG